MSLQSASQYYNDNVTYTGSAGSSTNPYCITSANDLCTLKSTIGTPTSTYNSTDNFILTNDINFNDTIHKRGITDVIACIHEGKLDGKNHSIYNMIFVTSTPANSFGFDTVSNVNFVNLIFKSTTNYGFTCNTFESCNFGVFLSNDNISSVIGCSDYVNDCTLNVYGKLNASNLSFLTNNKSSNRLPVSTTINTVTFNSCWLNFNITFKNSDTIRYIIRGYNSIFQLIFIDTAITGYIKSWYSTQATDNNSSISVAQYTSFTNSYIALDYSFYNWNATGNSFTASSYVTCDEISFIVTDMVHTPTSISWGSVRLLQLTSAQAKNSEYLQSIGFVTL